jgi:copper chaperone CopZ
VTCTLTDASPRRWCTVANSRARFVIADAESRADREEIEDALKDREGVQLVDIDLNNGRAEVRHGEALISGEEIRSTVEELGYEVEDTEES